MKRRLVIEVKNAAQFEALKRALALPDVRAFLEIVGALEPLSERGRTRVLNFVADKLAERTADD